jgi:hypothetical protein
MEYWFSQLVVVEDRLAIKPLRSLLEPRLQRELVVMEVLLQLPSLVEQLSRVKAVAATIFCLLASQFNPLEAAVAPRVQIEELLRLEPKVGLVVMLD